MRKISFSLRGPLRGITGTWWVGSLPSSSHTPCFPTQMLILLRPPPSPPPSHTQVCSPSSLPFHMQLTSLESHCSPPHPLHPLQQCPSVQGKSVTRSRALWTFASCLWRLFVFPLTWTPPKFGTGDGLSSSLNCPRLNGAWWPEPASRSHFGMGPHLLQTVHKFLWAVVLTVECTLESPVSTLIFPPFSSPCTRISDLVHLGLNSALLTSF